MGERDIALLDSSFSFSRTDSILDRIRRIESALQEGESLYTGDELSKLRIMHEEYLQLLKAMVE